MKSDFDAQWHDLAEEVISGMKEWRLQHPRASLREIEAALDERLSKLRARMVQDAARASAAADLEKEGTHERLVCPQCGIRLEARGRPTRQVATQHNQVLDLERDYGVCPQCNQGFFPPR